MPATIANTRTFVNNIDALLAPSRWLSPSLSFSFTNSISDYGLAYPNRAAHAASFSPLNPTQQAATRAWLNTANSGFTSVSGLVFTELTGPSDATATIRLAMSNHPTTAYAYFPDPSEQGGDAWFNRVDYLNPVIGTYAYHTFGHELGHALGLNHGHEPGLGGVSMDADRDSMEFSIMTYRSYVGDPLIGGYSNGAGSYAQSLMMYDIAAIQKMYGASFATNSGNTSYTFSTVTGEMFVNGAPQGTPFENKVFRTIWDGNGIDTYDFSNYSTNLSVDLAPGGWSNLDTTGTFQKAFLGDGNFARGHVFNALQYNGDLRSLIENAVGGSGHDRISGNIVSNVLSGGGGNDTVYGGAGDDTIYGGDGNDVLQGDEGVDLIFGENGDDKIDGGDGNDSILGGDGNDTLLGGAGTDTLRGGNGNDVIRSDGDGGQYFGDAGNDSMFSGLGPETMDGGAGIDTIDHRAFNGDYVFNMSTGLTNFAGESFGNFENALMGGGNDSVTGNLSANSIDGGGGNDSIYGAAGNDVLTGGLGDDRFLIGEFGATNSDTILDFGTGDDTIVLKDSLDSLLLGAIGISPGIRGLAFDGGNVAGNKLSAGWLIFDLASTLSGIYVNTGTGELHYDPVSSNGTLDRQLIAKISPAAAGALTTADFIYGV